MLRPATPLSILFFAAFVLLLLSTLSTPIIKAIPLATVEGVNFGVLGYCRGDDCSGISVGYSTDRLSQNGDFSLPSSTRNSLSSILIVHPVATLLTLICFGLAVAAHFHAPAHSPKYLLALLILTFPTLLVTLLAFLVDLLLFVPHVAWGGWVVLAATIIIVASGVVTCAMRRTLVSRKARKKRIAENNEMNGVNYQASRNHPTIPLPRAESPPPLNTNGHNGDKLPAFAAFELQNNKQLSEDRTPLNPRNPSIRSASTNGGHTLDMDGSPTGYEDRPPLPSVTMTPGRNRGPPPRDQYGNPIPPQAMQRRRSAEGSMRSNGMNGGPPGYGRGRGGYPPRGGPMPRGGYGPRGGPQNRGPPPPGWNGNGNGNGRGMGPIGPPPMNRGGMMMGRGGHPPGYDNRYYGQPPSREQSPYGQRRDMSPAPPMPPMQGPGMIGQAIEMDARSGAPSGQNSPTRTQNYGLRDSDGDVMGMINLQQQRQAGDIHSRRGSSGPINSEYAQDSYVPARANWGPPPIHFQQNNSSNTLNSSNSRGLSPIQDSPRQTPVELAADTTPKVTHTRSNSEQYYEDVDPRFAQSDPTPPQPPQPVALPSSLVPGYVQSQTATHLHPPNSALPSSTLERDPSYESIAEGARSPAASEASHFTSISQRGVNPNWRPPPPPQPHMSGYPPPRRPDVILEANPDFALNPTKLNRRPVSTGPNGGRQPGMINLGGVGAQGRYPGPEAI